MKYKSVIIPIRNEERFIGDTLRDLMAQDYPKGRFELIVVDGLSTDGTRGIVEGLIAANPGVNMRLISNPAILSSSARNIGIRASKGRLICVIDGHVHIPDRSLFRNIERLKEENGALCLARPAPLLVPGIEAGKPFWIAVARKSWLGHSKDSYIYSDYEGFVDPVSSAFGYDRSVFEKMGYFDESFDAAEDVEFNYRLKQAGILSYTSPSLTIYSYPRETFNALFRQQIRYGEGRARFVCKHTSGLTLETPVPALIFLLFLAAPFFALNPFRPLLLGGSYAAVVSAYLSVLLATGFKEAAKRGRVFSAFLIAYAIWATHMGLGWGFIKALPTGISNKSSERRNNRPEEKCQS